MKMVSNLIEVKDLLGIVVYLMKLIYLFAIEVNSSSRNSNSSLRCNFNSNLNLQFRSIPFRLLSLRLQLVNLTDAMLGFVDFVLLLVVVVMVLLLLLLWFLLIIGMSFIIVLFDFKFGFIHLHSMIIYKRIMFLFCLV